MDGPPPSPRAHGPGRLSHLIADDLDADGWLLGDAGADVEILAGLRLRLEAEVRMDEIDAEREAA